MIIIIVLSIATDFHLSSETGVPAAVPGIGDVDGADKGKPELWVFGQGVLHKQYGYQGEYYPGCFWAI